MKHTLTDLITKKHLIQQRNFTTTELCQVVGVGRPAFQEWMRYLTPSVKTPAGQGDSAIWSFADVVTAAAFKTLIKAGLARDTAALLDTLFRGPFFNFSNYRPEVDSIWVEFYLDKDRKKLGTTHLLRSTRRDVPPEKTVEDHPACRVAIGVNLTAVIIDVASAIKKI